MEWSKNNFDNVTVKKDGESEVGKKPNDITHNEENIKANDSNNKNGKNTTGNDESDNDVSSDSSNPVNSSTVSSGTTTATTTANPSLNGLNKSLPSLNTSYSQSPHANHNIPIPPINQSQPPQHSGQLPMYPVPGQIGKPQGHVPGQLGMAVPGQLPGQVPGQVPIGVPEGMYPPPGVPMYQNYPIYPIYSDFDASNPSYQRANNLNKDKDHVQPQKKAPSKSPVSSKPPAKRSRLGCITCRQRKKRCCETKPKCTECTRLKLNCVWPPPGTEHKNKSKELKEEENVMYHEIYGKIKVLRGIVEYKSDEAPVENEFDK